MKVFYIIDGSGFIHRAFHGMKPLSTSKGIPTNAIYGFLRMLTSLRSKRKSNYFCVVFDKGGKTFREEIYPLYKANRPATSEDLLIQFKYVKEILKGYNIPFLELEGYEADDIIGTIAKKCVEEGFNVIVVSSDKDLMQLVEENINVFDPVKEKTYDAKGVFEKFGVPPSKLAQFFAIVGDTIDNIPGAKGLGEKSAVELLNKFGSIEKIYKNIDLIANRKKEILLKEKSNVFLSLELARINTDLKIDFSSEKLKIGEPDLEALKRIFVELEFSSLLKELEDKESLKSPTQITEEFKSPEELFLKIKNAKKIAVFFETNGRIAVQPLILSMSIAVSENEAYFINLESLENKEFRSSLWKCLSENSKKLICYNFKNLHTLIKNDGEKIDSCYLDILLGAYLLNSDRAKYPIETVYLEILGEALSLPESLQGASIQKAKSLYRISEPLEKKLKELELLALLRDVEIPLSKVLSLMEINGIKANGEKLKILSKEIAEKLSSLEKEIYKDAGMEFNINSPKQLGEVLFEKLGLPVVKKTKTGYSTDVSVLEELSYHPVPEKILEYRSLSKIKSTYADTLPELIAPETGRIHTSFSQTATATGRLSSSDPNLQNIPIRTELGKAIRRAFEAKEGYVFISVDYSQIELRILAHLSEDKNLIETFRKGIDIHTQTATEIFKILPDEVTPLMRRTAKAINFGIIYGMSAFRLGKDLKIDTHDAGNYIKNYFERYPEVKNFIDRCIREAREMGFVKTILNRRRYIRDINHQNKNVRAFAERTAINSPVQGSAADIIKMAMIAIEKSFENKNLKAKIILQVHDELLFEVPQEEVEVVSEIVKKDMEGVFSLKVPLRVEIQKGLRWSETHD